MPGFKQINRFLINRLLRYWDQHDARQRRRLLGVLEGKISVLINLLLFAVKLFVGLLTGSVALISDAVHSLSDCLTSIVVIAGFHFSHKEADEEHPFGHGRAEHISTLVIAILLIIGGIELARYSAERIFTEAAPVEASLPVLLLIGLTILLKEGLADFSKQLGKRLQSDSLIADAWHHRLDALSTALVLAALVAEGTGMKGLDAGAGVVVSLLVMWSGFDIARNTVDRLMGQTPEQDLLDRLYEVCHEIPGVVGVHEVIVHDYGWNRHISLHVEVAMANSLMAAHEIAEAAEHAVTEGFEAHTTVHVDPIDLKDPVRALIAESLEDFLKSEGDLEFHDLRLRHDNQRLGISLGLVGPPGAEAERLETAESNVRRHLKSIHPELAEIRIDLRRRFHQ